MTVSSFLRFALLSSENIINNSANKISKSKQQLKGFLPADVIFMKAIAAGGKQSITGLSRGQSVLHSSGNSVLDATHQLSTDDLNM